MLVLGLILILIAAAVLVVMLFYGSGGSQATMFGGHVHAPALVYFLLGAAALLVFIMGLELVRSGLRRAHRNRQNTKRLRRLEKQDAERRRQPAATGPTGSTGTGETTGTAGTTDTAGPTEGSGEPTRGADGPYQTPPPAR
jgi:uncharacterized membrane protein